MRGFSRNATPNRSSAERSPSQNSRALGVRKASISGASATTA